MPTHIKREVVQETAESPDEKNYSSIDPNFVRKGVEDILRISELIRLQQNSIIAALNYSRPLMYENIAASSEEPVSAPAIPRLFIPQIPMSKPTLPSIIPAATFLTATTGDGQKLGFRRTAEACASIHLGQVRPDYAASGYQQGSNITKDRVTTGPSGAYKHYLGALDFCKDEEPCPQVLEEPDMTRTASDEFQRLLSGMARKKMKRNAPNPLNLPGKAPFTPMPGYIYGSPMRPLFSVANGFDHFASGAVAKNSSTVAVKLPPFSSVASTYIRKDGATSSLRVTMGSSIPRNAVDSISKADLGRVALRTSPIISGHLDMRATKRSSSDEPESRAEQDDRMKSLLRSNDKGEKLAPFQWEPDTPGDMKNQQKSEEMELVDRSRSILRSPSLDSPKPGDFQSTLKPTKKKSISLDLLTALNVLSEYPGASKSVDVDHIPLKQLELDLLEIKLMPGKKKPVMDVFIDDAVKVAPMISQPPSAQLDYAAETPVSPPEEPEPEPESNQDPAKENDILQGSLIFKGSDAFNFIIFKGSNEHGKKNFLRICETAWDKYQSLCDEAADI